MAFRKNSFKSIITGQWAKCFCFLAKYLIKYCVFACLESHPTGFDILVGSSKVMNKQLDFSSDYAGTYQISFFIKNQYRSRRQRPVLPNIHIY